MRSLPLLARPLSIRALLALLFVVPLISLLALWGFAASVTLINAVQEHNFNIENQLYGKPAQMLGLGIAQERAASFTWLNTGGTTPPPSLVAQRRATDAAVVAFERGVNANPAIILPSARPALRTLISALGTLRRIRAAQDSGRMSALAAFEAYNRLVDDQFRLYKALIVVNDVSLYQQAVASVQAGQAVELIDRESALVDGAMAARGQMSKAERLLFAQEVTQQRQAMAEALTELDPSLRAGYLSAYTSPAHARFAAMEEAIINSIGSKDPVPVNPRAFQTASFSLLAGLAAGEGQDRIGLSKLGTAVGNQLLVKVFLAGGIGLVAVALSVLLMAMFGRTISRELTGLQRSALDLATQRLPLVVERLSRGEDIDAPTEADLPPAGRIAEITRVTEAFSSVQRTAVEAAAGQARLRRGVSQVFRNLAWRSQSLLHRQLALLDAMERRSTEPETLEELFRLDHLTTRMRRHAEGLIILSGASPGRGWRGPVPLVDVLRAAVAEVEDYTRVNVVTRSDDAVAGSAVADLIHMLAELIENAATNSPARTEVTVRAERVAHGIVVEIEDRGLGMSEEEIEAANERFANPPEFDLADSEKLGFFVVARLAARHEIKITLRASPYGGVTAIVLLPHAVTIRQDADSDSAFPDLLGLPVGSGFAGADAGGADAGGAEHAAAVPAAGYSPDHPVPHLERAPEPWLNATANTGPADAWQTDAWQTDAAPASIAPHESDAPTFTPAADSLGRRPGDLPWAVALPSDDALSSYPELPRRVREASLHPELKNSTLPSVGQPTHDVTAERTPVESGALLASLQQGWQRGRTEAERTEDERTEDGADG